MTIAKFASQAGIYKDDSPLEAKLYWVEADKIRFVRGLPETIYGWERASTTARLSQLGLGVWYVSDFNAWRREANHTLARHDQAITEIAGKNEGLARELADRLARIETKIDNLVNR